MNWTCDLELGDFWTLSGIVGRDLWRATDVSMNGGGIRQYVQVLSSYRNEVQGAEESFLPPSNTLNWRFRWLAAHSFNHFLQAFWPSSKAF